MENTNKNVLRLLWVVIIIVIILVVIGIFLFPNGSSLLNKGYNGNPFDKGDLGVALKAADDALIKNPKDIGALIAKSLVLSQIGSLQFKEAQFGGLAEQFALNAIRFDAKNSEAWRALAYANEIQQKYSAAHQYYAKSISLNRTNALSVFGDAHCYDLEGETTKAEAGYNQALLIDPNLPSAHLGLARIYDLRKNSDKAISELKIVYFRTLNMRQKAEAAYSLGNIYSFKGDLSTARKYFEESTTIDSSFPMGWYGLGGVLFQQGVDSNSKLSKADRGRLMQSSLDLLRKSISLNKNQSLAYLRLGLEFSLLGQKQNAINALTLGAGVVPFDITLNADDKAVVSKDINNLLTKVKASK